MARGGAKWSKKKLPVAVRMLTEGAYNRALLEAADGTIAAGTEYEVAGVKTNIAASGNDKWFPWVRGKFYLFKTSTFSVVEWMVVCMKTTDSLPDFDTSSEIEELQKEGRLFARGFFVQPDPDNGGPVPAVKFEFRNVRIPDGECLKLVYRCPAAATSTWNVYGILEWRVKLD